MPQVGVGAAGSDTEVDVITLDDEEIALAAPEPPEKIAEGETEEEEEEIGATGICGPSRHTTKDDRLRTNSGSHKRGRRAKKYDRNFGDPYA
jgi:hypothetical protein